MKASFLIVLISFLLKSEKIAQALAATVSEDLLALPEMILLL